MDNFSPQLPRLRLPCGGRPPCLQDCDRIDPLKFREHLRRCALCCELVDAVLYSCSPITRAIYSPREAANVLGVSVKSAYRLCRSRRLRSHKLPGGQVKIRWRDLEDFLDGCRQS